MTNKTQSTWEGAYRALRISLWVTVLMWLALWTGVAWAWPDRWYPTMSDCRRYDPAPWTCHSLEPYYYYERPAPVYYPPYVPSYPPVYVPPVPPVPRVHVQWWW